MEQQQKKPFKMSTLLFMIKCVFRASPFLLPLMIFLTIISISSAGYALFILKDATNALVSFLNKETALNQVMFLVLLYLFITIVLDSLIRFILGLIEKHYYKQADRYFRIILLYKLGKLPQENMYNSDVYNKYEFTYKYLYMFQQLPWHLGNFVINFGFSKLLYIVIVFSFNIYIGIYCTVLFIANILVSLFITKEQAKVDKDQIIPTRIQDYYTTLLSTQGIIKETKINRHESYFLNKFKEFYSKIRDANYKVAKKDRLIYRIIYFLNILFNLSLTFLLLYLIFDHKLDLGQMALIQSAAGALIYAAGQFKYPTKYIIQFVTYAPTMIEMLYPLSKAERMEMKEQDYPEFKLTLGDFQELELQNISYKYPKQNDDTIENISLKIKKGEIISILGYNGSGKTTTCKLMCGILNPTDGTIFFNNQPLSSLSLKEYYKYFGIGFQDYARYSLSLKDNIGFGRIENVDNQEALFEAIKKTNLQNIIDKLPKGINTSLGKEYDNDAQDLSGGQWQRVILARAYMGSPEILILDEPTASIDPFEEERMLDEFKNALEHKTAILISHRISFARLADRIIMMDKGKIVETGSHDELLIKQGYYYKLFTSQQGLYAEGVVKNEE